MTSILTDAPLDFGVNCDFGDGVAAFRECGTCDPVAWEGGNEGRGLEGRGRGPGDGSSCELGAFCLIKFRRVFSIQMGLYLLVLNGAGYYRVVYEDVCPWAEFHSKLMRCRVIGPNALGESR